MRYRVVREDFSKSARDYVISGTSVRSLVLEPDPFANYETADNREEARVSFFFFFLLVTHPSANCCKRCEGNESGAESILCRTKQSMPPE